MGFSGYFNTSLNERSLCDKELSEVKELMRMKYNSEDWNYGVRSSLPTAYTLNNCRRDTISVKTMNRPLSLVTLALRHVEREPA